MNRRVRAASIHLSASVAIAAVAAALVFGLWYPPPLAQLAGGIVLFAVLLSVDVALGPVLTAVVASPGKPASEFRRDIAVIVALQLAALAYGLYSLAMARPVYVVFEVDRLQVVSAADIDPTSLRDAQPQFRDLPWTGPRLIAARRSQSGDELLKSLELALGGQDLAKQPARWVDFAAERVAVWAAGRPLDEAMRRRIDDTASFSSEGLRYLPIIGRHASALAIVAGPDARIVGYLPDRRGL